jgi:acetate kinase
MTDVILAINSGSSSIKFSLFAVGHHVHEPGALALIYRGQIAGLFGQARFAVENASGGRLLDDAPTLTAPQEARHREALELLLSWLDNHDEGLTLVAVGHRIVHGGSTFSTPILLNTEVLEQLEQLVPLAPLHQPHNLAAVRELAAINPQLPQVACFDTGFHSSQESVTQAFALPRRITDLGIKRYGFHGLSYEYIASVLPDMAGKVANGRVVMAHLGNGASMCAMYRRKSVDHSMGFTALEGLPMGTRCGSIDPGVVLYMLTELGMDVDTVTDLLYHQSGLRGVSGIGNDMRELLASDSPHATEAIDVFVYRIRRQLGALAAALGGLDALVLTGGIGEHAAPIRARICHDARWLGVQLDEAANAHHGPRISTDTSAVSVWVIPTDEDVMIARHTLNLIR